MDHALLAELFASAAKYHGALAQYAAAVRQGEDLESAVQGVVGTGLRYRCAIDRLLQNEDQSPAIVASRSRLERLRIMLASASRRYNMKKRVSP